MKFNYLWSLFILAFSAWVLAAPGTVVPQGKNAILKYLQNNYGQDYARIMEKAKLSQINVVHLRLYKQEKELEIWGGSGGAALTLLATFPICAMDFAPGPKLRQGDERTPEGVYEIYPRYNSNNWYMRIPLDPAMIDLPADDLYEDDYFQKGSVFFYCTNYPKAGDRARSQKIGINNPGGGICLHGNCVTAGCPSMNNRDWTTIYYFLSQHNTKQFGPPRVFISPFRFERLDVAALQSQAEQAAKFNRDTQKLGADNILKFWQKLKDAEINFKKEPALKNIE